MALASDTGSVWRRRSGNMPLDRPEWLRFVTRFEPRVKLVPRLLISRRMRYDADCTLARVTCACEPLREVSFVSLNTQHVADFSANQPDWPRPRVSVGVRRNRQILQTSVRLSACAGQISPDLRAACSDGRCGLRPPLR
jgi:hypothetical protein